MRREYFGCIGFFKPMETILHYYITYYKCVHRAKQTQSLSQKVLGEGHTIHLLSYRPLGLSMSNSRVSQRLSSRQKVVFTFKKAKFGI